MQTLQHPQTETGRNGVSAIQSQEERNDIGETKQRPHKRTTRHRRAASSGQHRAGHLHLKESGHSVEGSQGRVLEREDRWFERAVKEALHVKLKEKRLSTRAVA